MANVPTGSAQYLAKYGDHSIACSQYALTKLGISPNNCFLKLDEYIILSAPFQLGLKRSLFLASLSKQEMTFFQRYVNGIVGLSIVFSPPHREQIKLFIRCNLSMIGQMKGRDNVGIFVIDYKTVPDDLVAILGSFMDGQERLRLLSADYSKTKVRMTPDVAKLLGYNMYATITEPNVESKRIQVYSFNTVSLEHLEAAAVPPRAPGTSVAYQIYFRKYRVSIAGTIESSTVLPAGILRTVAKLAFSPELAEIVDDYWFQTRSREAGAAKAT